MPPLGMPLLGLSVFIHLTVIVMHRILHWTRWAGWKTPSPWKKSRRATYALGCFIITSVFFVMMTFAATLVQVCLIETHSNVTLAQQAIPRTLIANAEAHLSMDPVFSRLAAINNAEHETLAFKIVLFFALIGFTAIIVYADPIVRFLYYVNTRLPYRLFFVSIGIVTLCTGIITLVMLFLPIHTTAAYFVGVIAGL